MRTVRKAPLPPLGVLASSPEADTADCGSQLEPACRHRRAPRIAKVTMSATWRDLLRWRRCQNRAVVTHPIRLQPVRRQRLQHEPAANGSSLYLAPSTLRSARKLKTITMAIGSPVYGTRLTEQRAVELLSDIYEAVPPYKTARQFTLSRLLQSKRSRRRRKLHCSSHLCR